MKTLIFIVLKILELVGALIALAGIGWLSHKLGAFLLVEGSTLIEEILCGIGMVIAGILTCALLFILIVEITTKWFPQFIAWNHRLTDKIYNKYFK